MAILIFLQRHIFDMKKSYNIADLISNDIVNDKNKSNQIC